MARTRWKMSGEEIASCNCAWGCPCQFNALPTTGDCHALAAWHIEQGRYGDTSLDGVTFAIVVSFPGAVHEGDGSILQIVDERATPEQRAAIEALWTGQQGGAAFEIFSSVTPHKLGTIAARISFESDRESRRATVSIPDVGRTSIQPIRNPVTGEEHRARINLPNGFEYKEAEVGNTELCRISSHGLSFTLENSHAQLNRFEWSH